jgi:hypothetical protein
MPMNGECNDGYGMNEDGVDVSHNTQNVLLVIMGMKMMKVGSVSRIAFHVLKAM